MEQMVTMLADSTINRLHCDTVFLLLFEQVRQLQLLKNG